MTASRQGRENLPGDMAVYPGAPSYPGNPERGGRHFGLRSYGTVNRIVERIKARSKRERSVRTQLEELERKLNKSQRQA